MHVMCQINIVAELWHFENFILRTVDFAVVATARNFSICLIYFVLAHHKLTLGINYQIEFNFVSNGNMGRKVERRMEPAKEGRKQMRKKEREETKDSKNMSD